jgi:predicted N-formylglutamate amidohydrolase
MAQIPTGHNSRADGPLAKARKRAYAAPVLGKRHDGAMTSPYLIEGETRRGRWIVTCDHASNRVPDTVAGGDLGLPPADMARHIAYDVGAAGVSRALAQALDAPVILSCVSRLVIDPNRGEDDPTLVMKIYDGSIIPANRHADRAEIERRLDLFHRPYHAALARLIASRPDPVIVAIHSFTPQLRGRAPRPWHVGVLYSGDTRLARPLLARLNAEADLFVGDNQPYSGHLPGDALDRHGVQPGRPHVLVEIRNDLIETPDQQHAWGQRLAPMLDAALANAEV